jgi:hypothetical protein
LIPITADKWLETQKQALTLFQLDVENSATEQQDLIHKFCEITSSDIDTAERFLTSSDNVLYTAIGNFLT